MYILFYGAKVVRISEKKKRINVFNYRWSVMLKVLKFLHMSGKSSTFVKPEAGRHSAPLPDKKGRIL